MSSKRRIEEGLDDNNSAWATEAPLPSFSPTPLEGDCEADVAIIGGGYTGVSLALALSERFPERRVVLLEARRVGNGASGRNGGIVLNLMPHPEQSPQQSALHYAATTGAIERIEQRAKAFAPGSFKRATVMRVSTTDENMRENAEHAAELNAVGVPVRLLDARELSALVHVAGAKGALADPNGGSLNGVAYLRGVAAELLRRGVVLHEMTPVLRVEQGTPRHRVHCEHGVVSATTLVLATNGYTRALGFFRRNLIPLSSRVVSTRPLSESERAAIGWSDELGGFSDDHPRVTYASLTAGGRMVFGGGARLAYRYAFAGGTRDDGPDTAAGYDAIEARLAHCFPALRGIEIEARWSAPLGLTFSRACSIGRMRGAREVLHGVGFSGNGVTMSNLAGEILCDIYAGDEARWQGHQWVHRRMEWVPPEPMRWIGYQLFTRVLGYTPRIKPRDT
ncbi:MAG: FAD-binding oxidoreductase [Myxococcales bacterium]|nr:FAD-binding oxidoreductase [Myxococcales bacterium]